MKDILFITPPFTQLNTPYPATPYLKGFLNTKNISSFQIDLGIEVVLEIFSKKGLQKVFDFALQNSTNFSENSRRIYALKDDYIIIIDEVISFLQGKNQSFARRISGTGFLPQASRFSQLDEIEWAFGTSGIHDKAKHLATLFLEDVSDFIKECVDENFGFSRYAERIGMSANSFDELYSLLQNEPTYIDNITLHILEERLKVVQPKLVCISVPFPGNLYSAFCCAQFVKSNYPDTKLSMGGGFPNTELRKLSDPRVFDFFDFITLDDGERPIELLFSNILYPKKKSFKRTFLRENGKVLYSSSSVEDYRQSEIGTPDYSDLLLDQYISVIEITNPMHSLWSDGRWNKLTMAHGCYWAKCTFCDVSLDYIKSYKPISASLLVDRMEQIIEQTGERGFHFVDEAAPPVLMKEVAIEIIRRKLTVSWWTNIRFEKSFSRDLCILLKASGCIAVSGGLEVASDRLLNLINKGVSVEQVARVTYNLTEAGIMVHAYLMYGYPTQTKQETIDSLEMVRQLFELGLIQSAFWHQFALTAHSPIGLNPSEYGIVPEFKESTFAYNDIQFIDKTAIDHDQFSFGLKKSLYNFMHNICFDYPLQEWFDFKIPKTKIKSDFIENCLESNHDFEIKPSAKIIWIGGKPIVKSIVKSKKGKKIRLLQMTFHDKVDRIQIEIEKDKGEWLLEVLKRLSIYEESPLTFNQFRSDYESNFVDFNLFWYSKPIDMLRERGLLVL